MKAELALQKRIAAAIVSGFIVFALVHKDISLLTGIMGFLFMAALTRMANESIPDFAESKEDLDPLIKKN